MHLKSSQSNRKNDTSPVNLFRIIRMSGNEQHTKCSFPAAAAAAAVKIILNSLCRNVWQNIVEG